MRVLVVCNDPAEAMGLMKALQRTGYNVAIARTVKMAEEELADQTEHIRKVICAEVLEMKYDGVKWAQEKHEAGIPILLYTSIGKHWPAHMTVPRLYRPATDADIKSALDRLDAGTKTPVR